MMIGIGFGIFLFSFYFFYNTSKRAGLPKDIVSKYIQKHPKPARKVGSMLMLISFVFLTQIFGFGAGVFAGMLQIMAVASLVIILFPLFKPNKTAQ